MIVFTITRHDGNIETLKTSRTKLTVGGAYTDDITLLDGDVSPEHGTFEISEDVVFYIDNGYGTLVNDRNVVDKSVTVSPDDSVRVGEVVITFRFSRDENISTREPVSFETDFSDRAPYFHSKPAHTPMPSLPETELSDSISSTESTPSWTALHPDPASSETSDPFESIPLQTPSSPRPTPYEAPSGDILLDVPSSTPRDLFTDNRSLAITIVLLMLFFWPIGLLANFLVWIIGNKRGANFGCIRVLMFINVLITLVVAYFIGGWISS
ncbi:MAG: hypothetical protein JW885_09645 [Deltaproteobacteria bacterium]|nr:hypothetical protein [Candidatus Zymogenaceae bacterium]